MARSVRPELNRLVATPLVTIGAVGAILVWEFEHVGSRTAAVLIAVGVIAAAAVVAWRLRAGLTTLSEHYESLLATAEEDSRRAEEAIRVKDEFLATLSHELRTPLNSVLGWSRLLASGKLDSAQSARAIEAIERAGWTQSRLVEDLLDVSRIAEGKLHVSPRQVLVQPIVESAIASLRGPADAKRIAIETDMDRDVTAISVDPDRLHRIVWHLLSNAIKFSADEGRVSVRLTSAGGMMRLNVRDSGIGFDPDIADSLFEPFHQGDTGTTRQYGGLGLGLGIVRHLVEQHGGTVTARSAGPNQGAEFEVLLPMRPVNAYTPDSGPHVEPALLLGGLSILVVDDNADDREFVRTSLEQFGAEVRTAASASEARERFSHDRPDVIVSDLMMPGEDGLQLIRQIRTMEEQIGRLTPAAALTALARAEDRRRALSAGYQLHVAKPVDPFELASIVKRLADGKRPKPRHE
jgi:signal transduction histidine kinase/ActR/RegA family two-component response regulator